MRKLFLISLLLGTFSILFSQNADKKTVKKELKYYKKHINEYIYNADECKRKDSIIIDQELLIEKLTADINALNQKLLAASEKKSDIIDTRVMPKGTSFQVQIGVYKNTELTKYLNEPKFLGYELDNNLIRYHLGYFRDYLEAKSFLDVVKRMGIKDAFITEYLDGQRVSYSNINYDSPINKALIESKKVEVKNTTSNSTIKNTTTTKSSATSNDKQKMQNNWQLKKDENGNDVIIINPKQTKPITTKVNVEENSNETDESMEDNTTITKPAVITTNKPVSTTKPTTSTSTTTTNKPATSTNNTQQNTNIKMEKNWQMSEDENGNQIIKIIPKKN